jgi:hypothetical protein
VVIYSRPKEKGWYQVNIRDDYARIERDGRIITPSLTELAARVAVRYAEVHDKRVPYNLRR